MKMLRNAAIITRIPFTLLMVYAVMEVGLDGIVAYQLASSPGVQVLVDLVIVCALFLVWMFQYAKKHDRNPWGYLVITLTAGSFGPLLYLTLIPSSVWENTESASGSSKV